MGFWNKLFGNNSEQKVGGMEDFMTLIRVYFQAAMAADLGITNLAALPDLRVFKTTLKVATVNNKLQELNTRIQFPQRINTRFSCHTLHSDAKPHILWNQPCAEVLCHPLCSFCQYLIAMLGTPSNGVHDTINELKWYIIMEDVAHRTNKDVMRLLPLQWLVQIFFVKSQSKAIAILL